ncbi:MAG: methyltransferase domain-containing protein [Holophagales bacterium]|nr:methyltransferase domain-containing protein [Holophagales bacterium]MBK9965742.1 methyltransferase domain-containing protein [Holophagales bacterium]
MTHEHSPAHGLVPEAPPDTGLDRGRLESLLADELDMAFRRRVRWLLDALDLRPGLSLLDLGCGPGVLLRALAASTSGVRAAGLDAGMERLLQARSAPTPAPLLRGDALRLPFRDSAFDRVLGAEVLEHLPDDAAALRELRRVLAPGGLLALSVPHVEYPFLWDPINRLWTALGGSPFRTGPLVGIWTGHERLYRPDDLAARVAAAGFEVLRVEEATHHCLPLTHFLLYGVGRPLVERGPLPAALRRRLGRLPPAPGARRGPDLLAPFRALLAAVDRPNDGAAVKKRRTFVNVLLLARRPA